MGTEVSVLLDASMAATDAGRRMQVVQSRCDAALEERAVWADEHLRVALAADDGLPEHGTYQVSAPLWALELGASLGVTPEIEDENVVSNRSWLAYTRE